jgi:hypothetical protein
MASEPYSTPLDHWRVYNTKLLEFYRSSGSRFDPKTQAFFAVPVGKVAIPVESGNPEENITEAQTNSAIYKLPTAFSISRLR